MEDEVEVRGLRLPTALLLRGGICLGIALAFGSVGEVFGIAGDVDSGLDG